MKQALFLLLIAAPLFFSCKKKNETKSTSGTYTFSLKKDGVPFTSNNVYVTLADENTIYFESYNSLTQQLQYNSYAGVIRRDVLPGTYQIIDGESEEFSLYHLDIDSIYYGPGNGTFTVISNDTINKIIQATFELDLYNDGVDIYPLITEGELTFHYE
ncbi:MAG: hypothetical protein IT221_06925 [Fluviicola sp.]|nr:hypothetical protein [Fluviicola sp.]